MKQKKYKLEKVIYDTEEKKRIIKELLSEIPNVTRIETEKESQKHSRRYRRKGSRRSDCRQLRNARPSDRTHCLEE